MSHLENLKKTTTLAELALLLGYKPKALSYILYKIPQINKYKDFTIPKKNGGERRIQAPVDKVKHLQKRLAVLLSQCFDEISKKANHKRSLSHGFRKDHSISTNANNHTNKRHVFNIDLMDFFPSINFGRVRGFFIKNSHFGLKPKIATIIAQIACHNNELPQGSPCSPIISNLIGHLLDIRMANFAKKTKCTYSRYADDLTFSTNRKEFPEKIASQNNGNEWATSRTLKKEIEKVGFKVNEKKTSLQYKTSRQIATGLVVNKKVNIKKEYYRQTRSMCHSLFQSNEFFLGNTYSAKPAISENAKINSTSPATNSKTPLPKNPQGKIKQLESILSYIYSVKRRHDRDNAGKRKNYPNAITKLYRKFLFYKHFFSLNCPLIICEGKTDIVYLKCALRQLANEYGEFIEKTGPSFILKIDFLNLTKNLKDVLAISEGTGGLGSLMGIYEIYMKPFKGEGKKHPVIILIDNDSGSKEIIEIMKRKKKWDPSKPFAFFTENLYVVHISSESGTSEMAIEDLFDDQTQNTTVDGKKFNRKPKIDSASEYGKIVFAEKVIRANENSINFDGFKKVLNSFKAATQDYNKRITV